ncbi:MAG TPA: hypothetical protein VMG10_08255 [Gemmataceae bacterium]|nr:hypothetical protein [Gemmataceae bacterium]
MSQADFWYIRFPDGRVLRAASTVVLRQELNAGHVPLGSTVRRSPIDEWVALAWTQEFADLVEELAARQPAGGTSSQRSASIPPTKPQAASRRSATPGSADVPPLDDHPATVGSRLDSSRLHLVGVRGHLDELLAALDSALAPKKLLLGVIAGLLLGVLFLLERAAWFERDGRSLATAWCLLAVSMVVFDALSGLLTRLTFIELARLRPARWREGLNGLGRLTVWIVASQVIVRGFAWGLIVLLRWLPFWLGAGPDEAWSKTQQILAGSVLALGMVAEALLWPVFFFWWLIPPLLVVEDCTVWAGLRQWLTLLRRHLGRVFLYQTMAVGLGVLVTAPFLLLIAPLFLPTFYPPEALQEVAHATRFVLLGLACAPLLTYWITSNVFIYLNLRYGANSRR